MPRPPRDPCVPELGWLEEAVSCLIAVVVVAGVVAGLWLLVLDPILEGVRAGVGF